MLYRVAPAWPRSATPSRRPPESEDQDRPPDAWEADGREDGDGETWLTWRLVAAVSLLAFLTTFAMATVQIRRHAPQTPVQGDTVIASQPREP